MQAFGNVLRKSCCQITREIKYQHSKAEAYVFHSILFVDIAYICKLSCAEVCTRTKYQPWEHFNVLFTPGAIFCLSPLLVPRENSVLLLRLQTSAPILLQRGDRGTNGIQIKILQSFIAEMEKTGAIEEQSVLYLRHVAANAKHGTLLMSFHYTFISMFICMESGCSA